MNLVTLHQSMIVYFVDHLRRKAKPKKHRALNPEDGVSVKKSSVG